MRFFASSIPHRTASLRVKTSIVTSGSRPSRSRMLAARAKYTSAESPDMISREGRVLTMPIRRGASRSLSSFAVHVVRRRGLGVGRPWGAECSVRGRGPSRPGVGRDPAPSPSQVQREHCADTDDRGPAQAHQHDSRGTSVAGPGQHALDRVDLGLCLLQLAGLVRVLRPGDGRRRVGPQAGRSQ